MVAMDEQRDLIVRSQNGDPEAFAALIGEHKRMIHSLCYRMSGSSQTATVWRCRWAAHTTKPKAICQYQYP
jgi:hypothetical protein